MKFRELPVRVATGAYILHAGIDKWRGDEATAQAIHAMAVSAYPVLKVIPASRFLRLLAVSEVATGALLLAPFVPASIAGAALTGFSGALVGMYARAPGFHKPGSVWPTQQGIAVSKDVWMLGIGLSLLVDARLARRVEDGRG